MFRSDFALFCAALVWFSAWVAGAVVLYGGSEASLFGALVFASALPLAFVQDWRRLAERAVGMVVVLAVGIVVGLPINYLWRSLGF